MQNVRWHHECARIKRFDHDYVVVMGGTGQTSNYVNVIEFYDLTTKPATWETIPGRRLLKMEFSIYLPIISNIRREQHAARQAHQYGHRKLSLCHVCFIVQKVLARGVQFLMGPASKESCPTLYHVCQRL